MSTFPNIYTHRKVADTAAKACTICFKPSSSVLVTPEKQDFFYVCPSHLKEPGFCTPIIDQAAVEAKKKKELEEEVERVKKEYEEKQRKKKEKEEADKSTDKDKDKEKNTEKASEEKTNETKKPPVADKTESIQKEDEEPRVFALHRSFYQNRLATKRQAEMDKRTRERMQNPTFFPSVPKGFP
ncbi:hypothetical protein N0V82_009849 [Gnomoniopsis sp. IMI 355080]|nr:hypothetical protein N0V82_009849 [Gnomoniopsis sp. IMI 355080]